MANLGCCSDGAAMDAEQRIQLRAVTSRRGRDCRADLVSEVVASSIEGVCLSPYVVHRLGQPALVPHESAD
jgi:hypothetical protein